MSNRPTPEHYRPAQKALHWVVLFGLIFQIAFHEAIVRVMEAKATAGIPVDEDVTYAWVHVSVGSMILLAVIARLFMRFKYGAPGHAPGTSAMQAKIANAMHWSLYGVMVLLILAGMLTWNGIAPLGGVHGNLVGVLFVLVVLHAVAAIYNHYGRKDGTLSRMMPRKK